MIVIGCKVKRRNFSFFGLVGRVLELFNEVLDNIEVSVLNGREKWRIPFLVLRGVVHSDNFDEMPDGI